MIAEGGLMGVGEMGGGVLASKRENRRKMIGFFFGIILLLELSQDF